MRKPVYNPIDTDQAFQDVIESDFNPDIIQVAIIDMWDAGYRHGLGFGIAIALMGLGSVCVGHKVYEDLKKRLSKEEKES